MRHDIEINPFFGIAAVLLVGVGATTLIVNTANAWGIESDDSGIVTVATSTPVAPAAHSVELR